MSANEFKDQENAKPDWFSLVESDTRVQKNARERGFRVMALAGPLLLISAGLLFAQTNEGQNASATEETAIAAPATPGTVASAPSSDVGVATDPVATSSVEVSTSQPSESAVAPQAGRSHSSESVHSSTGTTVNATQPTNTISTSPQGFVPPTSGVSNASSDDDDAFDNNRGHNDDDDAYEHENSDEGDDD